MADGFARPNARFKITAPAVAFSAAERITAAYALVEQSAPALVLNQDPASGFKMIARAAAVSIKNTTGEDDAVLWLTRMARELRAPHAKPADVRAYSKERMMRIALAFWHTLLIELRGEDDLVIMPSSEILEAMALLAGVMLSSSPHAKVPSKLRALCDDHAKAIMARTKEAAAGDNTGFFSHVLTGEETRQ